MHARYMLVGIRLGTSGALQYIREVQYMWVGVRLGTSGATIHARYEVVVSLGT